MFYIESDIKKIQTKTNLYIQKYGSAGAFHLAREIIQNNIDECIDPESNGSSIHISYDISTDTLTCEDDGRGFPEKDYPLDIFCTTNQSGSKFFRDQGGDSAGEFGVGMTVVNALSDKFSITSYRDEENYKHTIEFAEGEKVKDIKKPLTKNDRRHGSTISFVPSSKYLGANTSIPYKEMIEWVEKMTFFIRKKKIKIKVDVYKGLKLKDSYTFKPRKFEELLEKLTDDTKYSPKLNFSGDNSINEKVRKSSVGKDGKVTTKEVVIKKGIHLDVALRYVPDSNPIYDTYCNYTNTIDGGIHQDTVERCFCNYMQNKTKATMTDNQKEKTPILWDDVRAGLRCVINLSTNAQVGFVGNAKTKIGGEALIPYLNEIVNNELEKFFTANPAVLNEYIKIIKLNAKARVEATKVKSAVQKERMTSFKEHEMLNYIRPNNTGKNQYRELFLVEGQSASGSARNASDPDTQGFILFRGNTANAFKCSLAEIMENKEWRDYVNVLRCGIGKNFDINKLYFNRINIMTDEDVDGFGITSGMLAFHYLYYRPIIEAGKVFKVFTPLYALDDKEHPFVKNKTEMVEIYHKKISKNYKVNGMSKSELRGFLTDTYDYKENLIRVGKDMGNTSKYLIEAIIAYMVTANVVRSGDDYDDLKKALSNQKFVKYLMSNLQKKFKEVILNGTVIEGVVDGRFCSINISNRFIRKTSPLISAIKKYGYLLQVTEKNKDMKVMSIGEFLDDCTKYTPKIITRYKGLGELNSDQLYATTLDINNRVSVQFTVEDFERELGIFETIHGSSKKDLEARKKLIKNYKIKRDELDN